MSTQTTNLNLFKYDVATDGKNTFNMDTALNENWDKIDSTVNNKADNNHNHNGTYEPAFSKNSGFNKNKSDSITSASTDTLATSKAVKDLNDSVSTQMTDINQTLGEQGTEISNLSTQVLHLNAYKTVGGTANALSVIKQGFKFASGQYVDFKPIFTNTGTMTLNVNGLGVKHLKDEDGEPLSSGDIEINKYYRAIYNSGTGFFQLAPRGGVKINGANEESLVVGTGQTLEKGDLIDKYLKDNKITTSIRHSIGTYGSEWTKIEGMTDNTAIIYYAKYSNGDYQAYFSYLTIANDLTISSSNPIKLFEDAKHCSMSRMTDTEMLFCFQDDRNSDRGTACVITYSGGTLVAGSEYVFGTDATDAINVVCMTSTSAVVTYNDTNNRGLAKALIMAGNTVSQIGSMYAITSNGAVTYTPSLCRASDTSALFAWRDLTSGTYSGKMVQLHINGATVVASSKITFSSSDRAYMMDVTYLDTDKAALAYIYSTDREISVVAMIDTSATNPTVSFTSSPLWTGSNLSDIKCCKIADDSVFLEIMDEDGEICAGYGLKAGQYSWSKRDYKVLWYSYNPYIDLTYVSNSLAVATYRYGTAYTYASCQAIRYIDGDIIKAEAGSSNGVAKSSGTEGETIKTLTW